MKSKRALVGFLAASAVVAMALFAVASRTLDGGVVAGALPFVVLLGGLYAAGRRGTFPRGGLIGAAAGAWIGLMPHLTLTLVHRWIVEPVGLPADSTATDFGRVTVPLFLIGAMILGWFVGRARTGEGRAG